MRTSALSLVAFALLLSFAALAGPISAGDVTVARGRPVAAAEFEVYTQSLSTTPAQAFNAEMGTATTEYMQEVRISNRHGSNGVCFKPIAKSGTCSTTCSGSGMTCSASSTDGDYLAPGSLPYVIPLLGDVCPCIVASAASTTVTAARVKRSVQW